MRSNADLKSIIRCLSEDDGEVRQGSDRRDFVHGLISYPAMMIPRLQRGLIEAATAWDSSINFVYDPFVGSGTVMTEAMLARLQFVGTDINPLAVLICQVKSELVCADMLQADFERVLAAVQADRSRTIPVRFTGRDKWFTRPVLIRLSKLRRAIQASGDKRVRRFWWVVLAEVVRLVSNARTSTVKLHIRPTSQLSDRPDPVSVFGSLATSRMTMMAEFRRALETHEALGGHDYSKAVDISVASATTHVTSPADMLMTSPPYGDNHTTVAYGQASYLALNWVPKEDLPGNPAMYTTSRTIDTASLGGSSKHVWRDAARCVESSPTLQRSLELLKSQPADRATRVAGFFKDLDLAVDRILDNLKPGAPMIWTLGDRNVGSVRVPMDVVLTELIGGRATYVDTLSRGVPASRKRMPYRNSIGATMSTEKILVLRRS